MKRRGRPKSKGLLTTREFEVLDLLREGLSNREIAERLGISLAGAKFHVSEIIGKLGVSSREEAAQWRPRVPGIMLPSFAGWRLWAPGRIAVIAAGGSAVALAIAALVLVLGGHGSEPSQTAIAPTATTVMAMRQTAKEVGSLDEAQRLATFPIVMPEPTPPGYRITSVQYFKPDFRCEDVDVNHCERVHNDSVTVRLDGADGRGFTYAQGFGQPIAGSYVFAPQGARGSVALDGREVHWVTGHLRPGISPASGQMADERDWVFDGSIQLAWFQSRDENRTGTDSPHCMGLGSTSLSLEELLAIAALVPRAMAAPAQDPYSTRC